MNNNNQPNETTDNKPKHEQPKADNNTILLLCARTHASPSARPHTHTHTLLIIRIGKNTYNLITSSC